MALGQSVTAFFVCLVLFVFADQAHAERSIRPFRVDIPEDRARRPSPPRARDALARQGNGRRPIAGRAAGEAAGARSLLGHGLRLAQGWKRDSMRCRSSSRRSTGVDIHFIHVRSRHPNALPVIITHGWPGSVIEQLKIIGPLTDPTAYGGRAEDAFDVVIPSMPGYGFSGKPTEHGLESRPHRARLGRADEAPRLHALRRPGRRLGLARLERDGAPGAAGLLGIHINLPATVPPEMAAVLAGGGPAPAGLSEKERAAFDVARHVLQEAHGPTAQ